MKVEVQNQILTLCDQFDGHEPGWISCRKWGRRRLQNGGGLSVVVFPRLRGSGLFFFVFTRHCASDIGRALRNGQLSPIRGERCKGDFFQKITETVRKHMYSTQSFVLFNFELHNKIARTNHSGMKSVFFEFSENFGFLSQNISAHRYATKKFAQHKSWGTCWPIFRKSLIKNEL